ncbi:hypothetical protein AAZX31_07G196900 [Glycine max]|uniref:Chlororespiratory reduction 42 n=2 Tax=Glycine subgen. Soja TaxID=1462606 RepID=A0A0R0J6P6_SOYBN|nr:uncharacterized protein LOC100778186 [Glycine max]XP_014633642.1 uncharacterized protein LOC100778186 [Glycine max]XP_028241250.1 uncharacterized protein LOC114419702 [Glycine soja]XP_028241251.1 uncharacterized protein LOC114419702 [Glycine soja]KAG5010778.1 hypothetical protein JHK87_019293 [Glycine soja]KAG5038594.1 hypothetical protein JHK86_019434 [Glycine max]KAH1087911.1 hypothetical protein GYH30_019136 [Glycine max]KAH1243196.1 hypothetical protein GmHk_07G020325 [Glycine max]KH|eukprot:XP_014633641.1 uncharacterized protein LOC100778186 [Glycine max]
MALSFSYAITKPFLRVQDKSMNCELQRPKNGVVALIKCESKESSPELPEKPSKLEIGSPIIFIEAPKIIKTAATMPCLRVNSGLVKPGDVGRIVSRKPKDVWAVRLRIGTYLIDGKYFKPLDLAEYS